jgi:hypothetical protein
MTLVLLRIWRVETCKDSGGETAVIRTTRTGIHKNEYKAVDIIHIQISHLRLLYSSQSYNCVFLDMYPNLHHVCVKVANSFSSRYQIPQLCDPAVAQYNLHVAPPVFNCTGAIWVAAMITGLMYMDCRLHMPLFSVEASSIW